MASSDPKHPVSTIGPAPSLADALRRFRTAQALSTPLADPLPKGIFTPAEVSAELEKIALHKAKKAMRRVSGEGLEPAALAARGFRKYKKHGGKKPIGAFLEALK